MRFDPTRAAIRFGCGLSPKLNPPRDVAAMLDALRGPDRMVDRFAVGGMQEFLASVSAVRAAGKQSRKAPSQEERDAALETLRQRRRAKRQTDAQWLRQFLLRRVMAEDGLRERLTFFWADHFTAQGRSGLMRAGYFPYVDEAIRPHVAGRFAEMLKAAVTHPLMLMYLDQHVSAGPNSARAKRGKRVSGLNENLARELLELHTLGVDGPYGQGDVRELATLLTGLSVNRETGFVYRPAMAEPGVKSVLGRQYGGGKPALSDVEAALDDLARHPATATHVARKLAVHFVGDTPDGGMVAAMTEAYLANDGALLPVYAAMLEHPGAWQAEAGNVKQPIDFVTSTLRALGVVPRHVPENMRKLRRYVVDPLVLMGQSWAAPAGPDGWPEEDEAWITPQRMAARLQWAMTVPFALTRLLPDPRDFVETALGPDAPEPVRFAAKAAETRAEGVGLVLASPAFHRM